MCNNLDVIILHLIPRRIEDKYLPGETIVINRAQFSALKGFIPIKKKKLFNNKHLVQAFWYGKSKYAPTLSDGTKGKSERVELPTTSEVREEILKQLGL